MTPAELLQRLAAGTVSGDVLAREAGVGRAAMWKRIESLRSAGIDILAEPGRGYRLARPPDLLDESVIRAGLGAGCAGLLESLEVAWSVDSTNSVLLAQGHGGARSRVLLAETQTGGRGRRGRGWVSPPAANLYLSVARGFDGGLARLGGLSLVAGIACAEALQALGADGLRLKWPNDLVVDGRKLGGVLVEGGGEHAGPVRAVVGIGINVAMPRGAADAIKQPWTDLRGVGVAASRSVIAGRVVGAVLLALDAFDREGLDAFGERFAALDALAGRQVEVADGRARHHGIARGIAADGALRVEGEGGMRAFHAGEVSVHGLA